MAENGSDHGSVHGSEPHSEPNNEHFALANDGAPKISTSILIHSIESFAKGDARKVSNFLQAIEHAASIGNWSEEQKYQIAIMKLKNEALESFNTSSGVKTWEALKSLLTRRFQNLEPRSIIRRKLNVAAQRPGEDPVSFSERVKVLMLQINPKLEEIEGEAYEREMEHLTDRFVDGLRPTLRRTVLSRQPDSWYKAVEIAQLEYQLEEMDKNKSFRIDMVQEGARPAQPARPQPQPQFHQNQVTPNNTRNYSQPQPQFHQNQSAPNNGRNYPPQATRSNGGREIVCYNCEGKGHIRRDCPTSPGNNLPNQRQGNGPTQPPRGNGGSNNGPVTRCPVCSGVRWHQVSCPAATPVTQVGPHNPPTQRDAPNADRRLSN